MGLKKSRENGMSLSEASKLNKRTLILTFSYSGRHYKSDKKEIICSKLGIPGRIYTAAFQTTSVVSRPALLPLILMEVESCQNCDYSLQKIKHDEASATESVALAGQSRSFLLSDYTNDTKTALL